MWTTVATSLLAPQIHPHLSAGQAWHGGGKGHTAPPSLHFLSTSAWLAFALKRALRNQSSFCPSPPGLQGWPILDFDNKIFHSLKLQHPTSCSMSLCFPETRLPWFCLIHQYIRRHLVSTLSGSDRVPGIQRQQDCSLRGGGLAPWWVLTTTEVPFHQAVKSSMRTRLGKLWLV